MKRSPARRTYIPEFDGLRALAAIGVIAGHAATLDHPMRWTSSAFIAVRFFFVLSGFLITGILLDHVAPSKNPWYGLRAFYIRRALRIFPAYYVFLLVFLLIGHDYVWESIVWTSTYFTNFYFAVYQNMAPPLSHFWTLAVEEQFYLVWPVVVILLRNHVRTLLTICMVAIGAAIGYREIAQLLNANRPQVLYPPIACLDTLTLGAAAAILMRQKSKISQSCVNSLHKVGIHLGIPGVLAILILRRTEFANWIDLATEGQFVTALASIGIILHFATKTDARFGQILKTRPLIYLGTISYGLYIFHFPLDRIVFERILMPTFHLEENFLVHFTFVLGTSIVVSSISWFLLEKRLLDCKKHFPYQVAEPQVPIRNISETSISQDKAA